MTGARNMSTIPDMGPAEKIEEWLRTSGRTAAWLANQTGLASGTVSRYLSDKRDPRRPELVRLAKAMGVSLDYLADDDVTEPPQPLVSQRIIDAIRILGEEAAYRRLIALDRDASKPDPPIRRDDVRVEVYETPASKRRTGR
jgi:transcriptional regulator with XRE-family HTH domain